MPFEVHFWIRVFFRMRRIGHISYRPSVDWQALHTLHTTSASNASPIFGCKFPHDVAINFRNRG